jgi:hypothetical protein
MICTGPGPLGMSPSLTVGACDLAASSDCRCNSAGSPPCSLMMLSSSSSPYSVTMTCPSFAHPAEGSPLTPDYRTYVLPVPPAAGRYAKSQLQERQRRLYAGLLTLSDRGLRPFFVPLFTQPLVLLLQHPPETESRPSVPLSPLGPGPGNVT